MTKPQPTRQKVRQADIAERAHVSVSTVSRVLNHADGIRDEVREQVWRIATELGYEAPGRSAEQAIRHVGFFTTLSTLGSPGDPFHTDILRGAEAECRRRGIRMTLVTFEIEGADVRASAVTRVANSDVDAALLLSIDDQGLIEAILALNVPTVGINIDNPYLGIDTYIPNNRAGAYFATKHLIDRGHERIVHVTNPKRATIRNRHEGYRAALEDAGLEYNADLVVESGLGPEQSHEAMAAFLAGNRDFTAVFCANDHAALGVVHALREAGLDVPSDVSVMGFDDIPMATFMDPPLTTMRVQREELGAATVRRLHERSQLESVTPIRVEIATQLVERGSVRDV